MNKKIKVFYIIDLVIMMASIIGMIVVDNGKTYGLSALTSVGYFVVLALIFIISLVLLIIVSIVYFIIKLKRRKE